MAIKAINNTAGADGIIPTLLVYRAYPRMIQSDPPLTSIETRAQASRIAMLEVEKMQVKRKVDDALAIRNGPKTINLKELTPYSEKMVYREKKGWTGPHKLIFIDNQNCTVAISGG